MVAHACGHSFAYGMSPCNHMILRYDYALPHVRKPNLPTNSDKSPLLEAARRHAKGGWGRVRLAPRTLYAFHEPRAPHRAVEGTPLKFLSPTPSPPCCVLACRVMQNRVLMACLYPAMRLSIRVLLVSLALRTTISLILIIVRRFAFMCPYF